LFIPSVRDFARLGLMLANDGAWNGRQIIPRDWLREATTVAANRPHLLPGKATPYFGYGYQVWLPPSPRRTFALVGIYGQAIVVDPKAKLVMVHTAVRPHNDPGGREGRALWEAILEKLGEYYVSSCTRVRSASQLGSKACEMRTRSVAAHESNRAHG
jgi:CubicO group peptidase (beta-lactamase class C family)